jgi:hypothetical protein
MRLLSLRPERSASANSATSALRAEFYRKYREWRIEKLKVERGDSSLKAQNLNRPLAKVS